MHANPFQFIINLLAGVGTKARHFASPLKPLFTPYLREVDEARNLNPNLNPALIQATAGFALWAVIEDIMTQLMALSFYATLESADFATYHAYTPFLKITGAMSLIAAAYLHGVRYWLVYAIPFLLIIGQVIVGALIWGWMDPASLEFMDFGPSWWRSAE